MSKVAYQKLIDDAVFRLKCCLGICTQLQSVEVSEESVQIGDYLLVKTNNGCILKPFPDNGIPTLEWYDNYDDLNLGLPQPQAIDKIAAVRSSQGTRWLPGNIVGTWYPKGYYRSTGAVWEFFGEFSYQATQIDVDAGLINDQFVTPFTFENASKWNTKNDSIQFQEEGGNLGAPGTVDTFNVSSPFATLSRAGNVATLTIPNPGGSSYIVQELTFADHPFTETAVSGEILSICDTTGGTIDYYLPPALANNATITISKKDYIANQINVIPDGTDTIFGDPVKTIYFHGSSMALKSDGVSNWYIT